MAKMMELIDPQERFLEFFKEVPSKNQSISHWESSVTIDFDEPSTDLTGTSRNATQQTRRIPAARKQSSL